MRLLDSVTDSVNMNLSKLWELVGRRTGKPGVGHDLASEQQWGSDTRG